MSDIISRTFASGADKAITLNNREYARTMLIGNTWGRIRIGALVALTPNGTSNLTAAKFLIGACSGKTNPFSAATTTNFIGVSIGAADPATGNTWIYNAGSGNPYYTSQSTVGRAVRRVGTTITTPGTNFNSNSVYLPTNDGSTQRRWPVYVEITKASPNYTVKALLPASTADMATDKTVAAFSTELSTTGDLTGYWNNAVGNSQVLACDETAGNLDSVAIYWNLALYPLEVYDFRVYRFS